MSVYNLSKMLRSVNTDPAKRQAYFEDRAKLVDQFDLSDDERTAVIDLDVARLYGMGVHGLILRPFTVINKISEVDYLRAIRGE